MLELHRFYRGLLYGSRRLSLPNIEYTFFQKDINTESVGGENPWVHCKNIIRPSSWEADGVWISSLEQRLLTQRSTAQDSRSHIKTKQTTWPAPDHPKYSRLIDLHNGVISCKSRYFPTPDRSVEIRLKTTGAWWKKKWANHFLFSGHVSNGSTSPSLQKLNNVLKILWVITEDHDVPLF